MSDDDVSAHYTSGELLAAIRDGVARLGKTPATVTVDDLAPVDEFHVGGRQASEHILGQLGLTQGQHVLDVGCGLGGSARFAAIRYGCQVTGLDLTEEFVTTGQVLCDWVGLADRVALRQGSAVAMPFEAEAFDAAYMLHVGMNIADKDRLCEEVHRVLRPGASFGIYDLMRKGEGDLAYPVPWAQTPEISVVSAPQDYRRALVKVGFTVTNEHNRGEFSREFFENLKARIAKADGPAPLGLHILMGETAPQKVANMTRNIGRGTLVPVELVARKVG
ncbi:MAG TPA: SAM-dependent methyltransferase [Acidobacteria bacterium]|nr:SAM-dependent methyltransferase [Acidobacteriota bacterium]